MGVALFDLLPEAIESCSHAYTTNIVLLATALGFATYFALSNWMVLSSHNTETPCDNKNHKGSVGAGSLSIHSLFDGIGLGLAFHLSPHLGLIVALAVICHDFSDGVNTVNMIMKNGGSKSEAFKWLAVDAIAPIIGAVSTLFFVLPHAILGLVLAVFAGFFLYIGASDLVPECHRNYPKHLTSLLVFAGMMFLWIVTNIAG